MDTVTGALLSADGQHILHPQTQIKQVVNLQAELNKIIKAISINGGTITLTKTDGTTFTATIGTASTSSAGLMSSSDKSKLDGVANNANNYSLPTASSSTLGGVKVGSNLSINNGVLSATNTTYNNATTSAAGLMSSSDKSKLDGVANNANNYSLPTASSSTLGGVKVGSGLSISNGVLSATVSGGSSSSSVTGVKGNSESSYRSGNVNLTAANIGAATSSHNHSATDINAGVLPIARGGTGQTSLANVTGVGSATKATQDSNGNNIVNTYVKKANVINTSVNIDEITEGGLYWLTSSTSLPYEPTYNSHKQVGLLVINGNSQLMQLLFPAGVFVAGITNCLYWRKKSYNALGSLMWYSWCKISVT